MPEWWWAEARSEYNHLATLTRQLDSHISVMVLLSFATDLYFICIQLLFSFTYARQNVILLYYRTLVMQRPSAATVYPN